eukprot:TRINITY_DN6115_c0_g1_i1.p1 TRINITY_DN6115_c0_g1~~TRINITY_DN6115_c0_g1_i1.p1  ORF type:complete len:259 (+),score=56.23 TRINITY_DN6115_c0_g1_i1:49-825(+)
MLFLGISFFCSKDDKFLAQKHLVTLSASVLTYDLLRIREQKIHSTHARSQSKEILIVANPSPMPKIDGQDKLEPLVNCNDEAKLIEGIFSKTHRVNMFVEQNAIKEKVLASLSKCMIAHFATHNVKFAGHPLHHQQAEGFGLALSNAFLTNDDLHNQGKIFAKLVCLSACETLSGVTTEDGVFSICQPFLALGVPTILATLYKISDEFTVGVMGKFYGHYNQQKHHTAKALQKTIQSYLNNPTSDVLLNLAAFVVFGL